MRRRLLVLGLAATALAACTSPSPPPRPVYSIWLHDSYHRYDNDFWIWMDDNDDCCNDPDDLHDALQQWRDSLPPEQHAELARQWSASRPASHPTPGGYPAARSVSFSDRGGGFGGGGGLGGGGGGRTR